MREFLRSLRERPSLACHEGKRPERAFKERCMSKVMTRSLASFAALSLSASLITGAPTSASAGDAGRAVAAGILGGALGVAVGAAAARAAAPPPVVVYERPAPVEYVEPVCHMERQPVYDEDGDPAGFRRVRVCD
jgi:hypothetical protein